MPAAPPTDDLLDLGGDDAPTAPATDDLFDLAAERPAAPSPVAGLGDVVDAGSDLFAELGASDPLSGGDGLATPGGQAAGDLFGDLGAGDDLFTLEGEAPQSPLATTDLTAAATEAAKPDDIEDLFAFDDDVPAVPAVPAADPLAGIRQADAATTVAAEPAAEPTPAPAPAAPRTKRRLALPSLGRREQMGAAALTVVLAVAVLYALGVFDAPPPPAPESRFKIEDLNAEAIDDASFPDLKEMSSVLALGVSNQEQRDLYRWALARVSLHFLDVRAQETLATVAEGTPGALGIAASLATAIWNQEDGLPERARAALAAHAAEPHVAYMASYVNDTRAAANLANVLQTPWIIHRRAELALALDPATARGLTRKLAGAATGALWKLRAAELMDKLQDFSALNQQVLEVSAPGSENQLPAQLWPLRLRYVLRSQLRKGLLDQAVNAAAERATMLPDVEALLDLAALRWAKANESGEAIDSALSLLRNKAQSSEPALAGRLLYEQFRMRFLSNVLPQEALRELEAMEDRLDGWRDLIRAILLARAKQDAAAVALLSAIPESESGSGVAQVYKILLEHSGKARIAALRQLGRTFPSSDQQYQLAVALLDAGRADEAAPIFGKLLWTHLGVVGPLQLLLEDLRASYLSADKPAALRALQTVLENLPQCQRVAQMLIELASADRDSVAELRWRRVLAAQAPAAMPIQLDLAKRLLDEGEDGEARGVLDRVQKELPYASSVRALYLLGLAWHVKDPIKARGYLIEAKSIEETAEVFALLGKIDESRGKLERATEAFERALELDAKDHDSRFRLADALYRQKELTRARDHARKVAAARPNDALAWELLGDILTDLERFADAVSAYTRAARSGERREETLFKRAKVESANLGRTRAAVRTLRTLLKRNPEHSDAYYLLAYALRDLGKHAEAISALEAFLKLVPDEDISKEVAKDLKAWRKKRPGAP
jgi:tetratricopeptide (TPR) repeat protein